jgi:hypothetical protein
MGIEGWRSRNRTQSHANSGASARMKSEFTDWNHDEGKAKPSSSLRVSSSAKSVSDEPACSKIAQKRMAQTKKTRIAAMRWLSPSLRTTPNQTMPAMGKA